MHMPSDTELWLLMQVCTLFFSLLQFSVVTVIFSSFIFPLLSLFLYISVGSKKGLCTSLGAEAFIDYSEAGDKLTERYE